MKQSWHYTRWTQDTREFIARAHDWLESGEFERKKVLKMAHRAIALGKRGVMFLHRDKSRIERLWLSHIQPLERITLDLRELHREHEPRMPDTPVFLADRAQFDTERETGYALNMKEIFE